MSFVLLFPLSSLSLPIFVLIVVRYAQALGIKDPFGVQGFAMELGCMRILNIKKKKKKYQHKRSHISPQHSKSEEHRRSMALYQ